MTKSFKEIAETHEKWLKEQESSVIGSPFEELNELIGGGFKKGSLVLVGARTSIGKTTFAANLCLHCALHKKKALFWSFEDCGHSIFNKLIINYLCLQEQKEDNNASARKADYANNASARKRAYAELGDLPIYISDEKNSKIENIVKKIEGFNTQPKSEIIFIDYVNKISAGDKDICSRLEDIRIVLTELRELAEKRKCVVVLLAQTNRQSANKTPMLHELKESGSLEESADLVILLHRLYPHLVCQTMPSDYKERNLRQNALLRERNRGQIIVAKNKNGPVKNIDVIFWPERGGWYPYSDELMKRINESNNCSQKITLEVN